MNIETSPIESFLETYANLYFPPKTSLRESWDEVKDWMMSDSAEQRKVMHLVDSLRSQGSFREPITVDEVDHDEDDHEYLICSYLVADGTHRVVAYMILAEEGNHSIDVEFVQAKYTDASEENQTWYNSKVEVNPSIHSWTEEEEESEEEKEWRISIMDALMFSFPLSDDEWVKAYICTSTRGACSTFWSLRSDTAFTPEDVHSRLIAELIEDEFIIDETDITITTVIDEEYQE